MTHLQRLILVLERDNHPIAHDLRLAMLDERETTFRYAHDWFLGESNGTFRAGNGRLTRSDTEPASEVPTHSFRLTRSPAHRPR